MLSAWALRESERTTVDPLECRRLATKAVRCPSTWQFSPSTGRLSPVGIALVVLWVVEGVAVVVEVPVCSQQPGLEIGQAVCRCFAQHPGWILE